MSVSGTNGNWVIGNATIKDMQCNVTIMPKFTDLSDSTMGYDITYTIENGTYDAIVDRIIYKLDDKVKSKSIDPVTVKFNLSSAPSNTTFA